MSDQGARFIVVLPLVIERVGTRMTKRHYAHLSPSYVVETIRASFPTLGIVPKSNVATIVRRSRKASR